MSEPTMIEDALDGRCSEELHEHVRLRDDTAADVVWALRLDGLLRIAHDDDPHGTDLADRVLASLHERRTVRWHVSRSAWAAAASLAFAITAAWLAWGSRTPAIHLERIVADCRIEHAGASRPAVIGDTVRIGDTVVVPSSGARSSDRPVVVAFADGSRLDLWNGRLSVLEPPTGGAELALVDGRIDAMVAPQHAGARFAVITTDARVEVIGTRFQIEADARATNLNVISGTVRFVRAADGAEIAVTAGMAARVDRSPTPIASGRLVEVEPIANALQSAADAARPGDVIQLRDGAYPPFHITRSGEPDRPIRFRACPGERVTIQGLADRNGIDIHPSGNDGVRWVEVEGFQVVAPVQAGIKVTNGEDIVIRGCTIGAPTTDGIRVWGGRRILIDANRIDSSKLLGISGTGRQITITNNLVIGSAEYGIQAAGYDTASAPTLYPGFDGAEDWLVANNTVVDCLRSAVVLWNAAVPCVRITVANNLFYRDGEGSQPVPAGMHAFSVSEISCRENLWWNERTLPLANENAGVSVQRNVRMDPRLAAPEAGDFHLSPASPARIDADPSLEPAFDRDGRRRDPRRGTYGCYAAEP